MSALEQKHEKILGGIVIRVSSSDRNLEMCQADRSYLLGRQLALEEVWADFNEVIAGLVAPKNGAEKYPFQKRETKKE